MQRKQVRLRMYLMWSLLILSLMLSSIQVYAQESGSDVTIRVERTNVPDDPGGQTAEPPEAEPVDVTVRVTDDPVQNFKIVQQALSDSNDVENGEDTGDESESIGRNETPRSPGEEFARMLTHICIWFWLLLLHLLLDVIYVIYRVIKRKKEDDDEEDGEGGEEGSTSRYIGAKRKRR